MPAVQWSFLCLVEIVSVPILSLKTGEVSLCSWKEWGKRLNFPAGFSQNSIKPKYPGFDPRLRRITFFIEIVELWHKCRENPPAKQISRFRGYNLHEKHLKSCVATEGPPSILSTALLEWKLITPHGRPYRFRKRTKGGRKWKVVGIPIGEIPIKAPTAWGPSLELERSPLVWKWEHDRTGRMAVAVEVKNEDQACKFSTFHPIWYYIFVGCCNVCEIVLYWAKKTI